MIVIADINKFDEIDFACKCGCGFNNYKSDSLIKLQLLRDLCDFPFYINSCCRCKKHNFLEGGSEGSEHLTCEGFDIECLNSSQRYLMIKYALQLGFTRIGIYKRFVHLGTSKRHTQNVIWYG